ncbi:MULTISPECIES: hypothetical protein [unclassified Bradyrhizobium]|uniref:hypothetical protein n=1 Tax=unclassified Bradyrhizobium TaxID=2631580 RepID=UPI0023031D63|nr:MULTISPECIES: hypothetical protein [unclassified Bradyrhizobium]
MILLFHRDTLPFDLLDVKSEAPEHIEAVALADFGVVVMGCEAASSMQRRIPKSTKASLKPCTMPT